MSRRSAAIQKVVIGFAAVGIIVGAYFYSAKNPSTPKPSTALDAATVDARADAVTLVAPPAAGASDASVDGDKDAEALGDADLADASPYDRHIARGNDLVEKKKYAEAVEEFSLALKEHPDDATALSHRGNAHVLAGDFRAGNLDLAAALTKTTDAKAQSEIWYRRGLLDQGLLGEPAKVAFAVSNFLSPNDAAKDKLGDVGICVPEVTRRELSFGGDAAVDEWLRSAPDVVTLLPSLPGFDHNHSALSDAGSATEAAVWTVAQGASTAPALPTVIRLYDAAEAASHLIFRAKGRVWALKLARLFTAWNGTGDEEFSILSAGPRIHVHGHWAQAKEETSGPADSKAHASIEGALVEHDALVDLAKGRVLVVERPRPGRFVERDKMPSIHATPTPAGDAFILDGLGCHVVVPVVEGKGIKDASARD